MQPSDAPYYCSQQINIPPELPDILKQFTKSAIRTQPKDVLAWSAAYFRAMANGEVPPVKERMEMPVATQKVDTGFTNGILRVLNKQLGPKKTLELPVIEEKWADLSLPKEQFDDIVRIGGFNGDVDWMKFFAVCCSALGKDITDAMRIACEILTADPDGGAARIPFTLFQDIYRFLAQVDGEIPMDQVNIVVNYLRADVQRQNGYVQPRNFLSPNCPKLSG
jgi:hypothetical protein